MVEQLGASNPVIHMAQTKTIRSELLLSLNFTSSPGFSLARRWRWGLIVKPFLLNASSSFWEAEFALVCADILHGFNGTINAEILVIFGNEFD